MNLWMQFIQFIKDSKEIVWLVTFLIAFIPSIKTWVSKPLKKIEDEMKAANEKMAKDIKDIGEQIDIMNLKLDSLDEDTADIIGDRLQESHDYYTYQQGWCPASEKARLEDMVHKYHRKGRNHLSDKYLDDIINLPEHPIAGGEAA